MWFSKSNLLCSLLLLVVASARIQNDDNPTGRDIHIVNQSDVKVDIFWVNPQTKELVKSIDTGILKGTDSIINSYMGHEFEIQELPLKTTGKCLGENEECRKAHFVVTSNEDQQFTIEKDISVTYADARSRAMEKAKKVSKECRMPEPTASGELPDLEEWAECLQKGINATLDVSREEIAFQAGVRKNMGRKLVDYACSDEEFPTTSSTYNQTLNLGLGSARNPKMKFLFQSETSKVILLENFVARSQCRWLKENAAKGGKNRLDWTAINDVAIRAVVERIYKALDQALNYYQEPSHLDQQRQNSARLPPLFLLHTYEKGGDTNRFAAEEHISHPLIGTFMLFCDAPEKGGAIHFPKAGTHVKPEAGSALLVTYMEPSTGETSDDVFTAEYVECPVAEGKQTTLKYHIPAPRE
ncbi:prolyl 4-hydroxylase [Seminavis robusta]|uniref:Prolyl 4-hydroxylase n=1 Tax=Seminavis robusta TaxID=568900 RepID=A0A9N8EEY9_9STRA|nr:prolyl 4-hydroxylase [Seminavis robusta]|eukprot:Sro1083_g239420.1 prolyl 4-hydroxylase (413) ;mRNA; f:36189-37427